MLSLDGSVRHVRGVLPMTALARSQGYRTVFVPEADAPEAALIPDVAVIPVTNLAQLVSHLSGAEPIPATVVEPAVGGEPVFVPTDFREVKGEEHVKRALKVAAAGGNGLGRGGSDADQPGVGRLLCSHIVCGHCRQLEKRGCLSAKRDDLFTERVSGNQSYDSLNCTLFTQKENPSCHRNC